MTFNILDVDILYINLDIQPERNQEFLSEMFNHGFSQHRLHRVSGILNDYKDGFDSYIKALKQGLSLGKPFAIVEDDLKINQIPSPIFLSARGFTGVSAMSLALSRYGVLDHCNFIGEFSTRYDYVIKANIEHPDIFRIFNMLVGLSVYYHDLSYVEWLINHLEYWYRNKNYISPQTKSTHKTEAGMAFDAILAFTQPFTFFTALKIPIFYHPGELEEVTRFNLSDI
tara:strand:- start:3 stop:683 length:681 start_codon:yes stop_codon:yes gene_type:complete